MMTCVGAVTFCLSQHRLFCFQVAPGPFGNYFFNKVANPADILLFRKRVERTSKKDAVHLESDLLESIFNQEEFTSCTSMEDLVGQYFTRAEDKSKLHLLGIKSAGAAVKAFVEKDDKDAIGVIVENQVTQLSSIIFLWLLWC